MNCKLTPSQRHFFKQIARITFVNPFGEERERADCHLLHIETGKLDIFARVKKIQQLLETEFGQLQAQKTFRIHDYQGENHNIMKFAWLFYMFHVVQDDFNLFIEQQSKAGDTAIELPFARMLTESFHKAGFNHEDTTLFIALFYQLHRGFRFISEAVSGDCKAIVELRMHLWNNIFTFNPMWYLQYLYGRMEDFSTLLLGETGTGKSLVAKAIGCSGFIPFDMQKRRFKESFTHAFQSINLSEYSASLLESELFGHKKGAFTGAIDNHQGIFARCSEHGAVFIDEIGEVDIPTQVKLLNVIQERLFSPVGSHEKHRFGGRVITATNRDIQKLRHEGLFRDDLYYRLCSDVIVVPTLQQRLEQNPKELRGLIEHLLMRVIDCADSSLVERIELRIHASLPKNYSWPGNVRELEQCIRRICLTGIYQGEHQTTLQHKGFVPDIGEPSTQQLLQQYCQYLYQKHGSYEAVARIAKLDRRTAKKYVSGSEQAAGNR